MHSINELRSLANVETEQAFVTRYPQPFLLCNLTPADQTARSFKTAFAKDAPVRSGVGTIRVTPTMLAKPELRVAMLEKSTRNPYTDRIFVGRTPTNDIVVAHHSVSKSHAFFECLPGGLWHLTDNGSRNGTMVRGDSIAPTQRVRVSGETTIVFGYFPTVFIESAALHALLKRLV
jgi:hypothetical protein